MEHISLYSNRSSFCCRITHVPTLSEGESMLPEPRSEAPGTKMIQETTVFDFRYPLKYQCIFLWFDHKCAVEGF